MPFGTLEHRRNSGRWALVRAALGLAQMTGAVATLVLLLDIGVTLPTLITIGITTALRIASQFLFGSPRRDPLKDGQERT